MILTDDPKTNKLIRKLYSSDPREVPLYAIADAARYVKVHENTLRSWVHGRTYMIQGKERTLPPVIILPTEKSPFLSFINLLEAFSLSSLTRIENLPFKNVRFAIETLRGNAFKDEHPLIDREFLTDSINLFVEDGDKLYNVSKHGQIAIKEIVKAYLKRIVRSKLDSSPIKVYPFSRQVKFDLRQDVSEKRAILEKSPRVIEVNPLVAFGRPTLVDTGIAVDVIASRYRGGDSVKYLAKDYGLSQGQVREAIRYEEKKAA